MQHTEPVKLRRNCEAILIPSGEKFSLEAGTEVRVTQSLGGTYTVTTENGLMARIAGKDADVLGLTGGPEPAETAAAENKPIRELVWDQLKTCYDPEIPANIVDLGLIYECRVAPAEEGKHDVNVKMTLTAPGCGMGASIAMDAKSKIESLPGVKSVNVELVWDPPWNPAMMAQSAKQKLGLI
ncbi:MAG: putative Fe-S cluster assembly protein SufT [Candidatus Omnitrophica bacterium]|nr:putative Fe-S cluster assembly protein SufT [Candidatus Omnitrophota bacterium]